MMLQRKADDVTWSLAVFLVAPARAETDTRLVAASLSGLISGRGLPNQDELSRRECRKLVLHHRARLFGLLSVAKDND